MPRYYFNIRDGQTLTRDEEGSDLPNIEAAIEEAESSAREILADMLRDSQPLDGQAMEITSEDGAVLRRVRFKSLFWLSA